MAQLAAGAQLGAQTAANVAMTALNIGSQIAKMPLYQIDDQSNEMRMATNKIIEELNAVSQTTKTKRCLVNGFASLFENSAPIIVQKIMDRIVYFCLEDPEMKLLIHSKIQDMIQDILKNMIMEERDKVVNNLNGECKPAFLRQIDQSL